MASDKVRVLVADDQADVLEALRLLLKAEEYTVETVASPAAALAAIEERDFDALMMDLNYTRDTTSGKEGLDLLSAVQKLDASLPVLVMTAWGSIQSAVEAMRRGARDYIEKPWDNGRLLSTLRTHIELGRVLRESQKLQTENQLLRGQSKIEMVTESRAMKSVLSIIERVGPSEANVLITGEHGTGKEVVARLLHASSPRARKPLVTVNAGGLSEGVFESELFGHVKGAFTDAKVDRVGYFELADGGTLLLDEIGNMPAKQQAKLLRALQSGEFQRVGSSKTRRANVRVISATNVDIRRELTDGRFREDLLYRLNTVEIHLPPLRDRHDDIAVLAGHFLRRQLARYNKKVSGFDREAMQAMMEYSWPGNVRELEHAVERAVLMAQSAQIKADDLGLRGRVDGGSRLEEMTLEDAEQYLIQKALARFDSNVSRAAEALGLSRSALYRRLQHYGITA